jgi:hypothetical protein
MRIDPGFQLPSRLCDATANLLNRFTLFCLPDHRRVWGEALIAEREQIRTPYERLVWAAGGVSMTAKEFLNNVFGDRWTWAVGIALGILSAVVDLRSETRWPYSILMISFSFALAYWQPRWAWRWPFLVACCLPVVVLATWNWGPYQADQFDVFYGLLPAAIGAVIGVLMRRGIDWLRHKPTEN